MTGASAKFQVLLTEGAEQDLESVHDYITEIDGAANANYVLDQLMEIAERLSRFPDRGSYPKELVSLGIREYRQISFKPYRVSTASWAIRSSSISLRMGGGICNRCSLADCLAHEPAVVPADAGAITSGYHAIQMPYQDSNG